MIGALRFPNVLLLAFSVVSIYFLAPSLDRKQGVEISLAFALILILSSHIRGDLWHWIKYVLYASISVATYFILFNNQPWDFLFSGGPLEDTAAPLFVCCVIMSMAGGLLLPTRKDRIFYIVVTLGLQIPLAFIINTDTGQDMLTQLARDLRYNDHYTANWQAWQFEWMMTYYMPVYFLNHRKPSLIR